MAGRLCPKCHSPIIGMSALCPNCGALLSNHALQPRKTELTSAIPHVSEWEIECETCGYSGTLSAVPARCPRCETTLSSQNVRAVIRRDSPNYPSSPPPVVTTPSPTPRSPFARPSPPVPVAGDEPTLEGIVSEVLEAEREDPDLDWGQVLFGILLMFDLALLGAGVFVAVLVAAMIALVVGSVLGCGGMLFTPLVFIAQPVIMLLTAVIRAITGRGPERDRVPVTNYRVEPRQRGGLTEFRLKGRLTNTVIMKGDWVRVWGPVRHGVVVFQRGERVDPMQPGRVSPLIRPRTWGWLWLTLLVIANLAAYIWLRGG